MELFLAIQIFNFTIFYLIIMQTLLLCGPFGEVCECSETVHSQIPFLVQI